MEQTQTLATTTLNGSINNSQTTLVVTSASSFPSSGTFSLMIDSEIMKVTGVSGTTFTVVRGQEGTSAASHTNGATVVAPLTVRALEALRAELITSGTLSSFTQQRAGRIFLPSDSPNFAYDNGSTIKKYGWQNLERLYPPITSDFSWVNQGSATLDDTKGFSALVDPAGAGDSLRMREKNLPAPNWSVTARFDVTYSIGVYLVAGIYMRESGTSKIRSFELTFGGGGECYVSSTNWTNATTYSATSNAWIIQNVFGGIPPQWFKLRYDGTNIDFYIGHTKQHLLLYERKAKNYFFTTAPDKVGFFADSNSASFSAILNMYSWEEGTWSEQLKNSSVSTLASSMDGSQTTLSLASASSFPTAGTFSVIVDSEIMKVTGVSGTTLTVVRGQEGTSAASHSSGATVTSIVTQRSLEALRAEYLTSGAIASFTQGRKSRLYLPTDSSLAVLDDGSNLNYLGPEIHEMKPFVTANFTWSNQGTGTVVDANGVTTLTAPARTPDSLRMLEINLPASPWSVLMRLSAPQPQARYLTCGPHMRESSTGKIRSWGFAATGGSPGETYIENINWTNNTTYSSDSSAFITTMLANSRELFWHKLFYDGTNIYYSIGPSKDCLVIVDTRAKNYHFTTAPDKVGIYANSNNATYDSVLNIYHWEEGTS